MNSLLNGLKNGANFTHTENGAVTHITTRSDLLDLFAMGGAMRNRSDADCILMFQKAYAENPTYALKCLFYLRDCRGGQGERRFWRVCMKWLAENDPSAALRVLPHVPEYGRWDDLYVFVGTALQNNALELIKTQLALDVTCKTPSLLAKWLKSENASSHETRRLAAITRDYLGMSHKQYRKTLSLLRGRIKIVETLMSQNRWDEIEFDKIPSKAGLIYKNAFARRDILKEKFVAFAKDKTTKVNAKTLYPYECVQEAYREARRPLGDASRLMANKRWDCLADYFNGASLNALAVVDTSGSMTWHGPVYPIDVAISLGLYCAEKAKGPFHGHYISFASRPELIRTEGVDFCDKVHRVRDKALCDTTNIEGVFDLLLNTALAYDCDQNDLPENIIIISDMEFNSAARPSWRNDFTSFNTGNAETLLEGIARKWAMYGYKMPHLIFWNVEARQNNIPMLGNGPISYVSGFSPAIFEQIMSGKTGYDLMMEKLDSERYAPIQ